VYIDALLSERDCPGLKFLRISHWGLSFTQ
jgi:hypothetical protein